MELHVLTPAARDVLAERRRQVEVEGFSPKHDDSHSMGEMARAAGCYALSSGIQSATGKPGPWVNQPPAGIWPWAEEWWKPLNRRYDLVRAGALILAEIERIDRAEGAPEATGDPN
jgi:hypothetical protein